MKRNDLTKLCESNGAKISKTVTGKVTHLLCEEVGTSKYCDAQNKGIPIHDEAWVHAQIAGGGGKKAAKEAPAAKKAPAKKAAKKAVVEEEEDEEELDPSSMSVGELKAALKSRGLAVSGAKKVLQQRLQDHLGGEDEEEEEEEEEAPPPKKKAAKRAQPQAKAPPAKKAKKSGGTRKVDDVCRLSGVTVHEDYDCMLNQTNIGANNNKYYRIQVLTNGSSFWAWNRWGRVGEPGQNALKGPTTADGAIKDFTKKFKDKTKNNWDDRADFSPVSGKYTLLEMDDGGEDEDDVEDLLSELAEGGGAGGNVAACQLPEQTQDLIKLIFDNDMFKNAMKSMEIDVKKMPLGKLSKSQLQKGNQVLAELNQALKAGNRKLMMELSSKFYTLVPHSFGRSVPPVIDEKEHLQRKFDLLAVLGDIEQAQNLLASKKKGGPSQKHPLDANYDVLKTDVTPVAKNSKEFKMIDTYSKNTMGRSATLLEVFKVSRHGEEKRFDAYKKLDNRKLLWHGTNVAVVVACLSGGLRIMPHSGGRVGKGIYFASEHGKSANYVRPAADRTGIMFLSEVALGKEHHITKDDWKLVKPPSGYDCIIAQGQQEPDPAHDTTIEIDGKTVTVPQAKPKKRSEYSSSYFSQTEYLVYNEAQNRIRYLLKFKF